MKTGQDVLGAVLVVLMLVCASSANGFAAEVRAEHPRMLLTKDDLPAVRTRCETSHRQTWQELKRGADERLNFQPDDRFQSAIIPRTMGFVYLVTGDEKYAKAGIPLLRHYAQLHLDKVREPWPAAIWPSVDLRRHNYIAYDWLYNAMTTQERLEIGRILLEISELHEKQDTWNHAYAGGYGRYEDAFYCGLALHKSGVDDIKAGRYLKEGFDFLLNQTVAGRSQVAADDGGIQSGMGYALYNYIPVESYFLSLWKSATGEDLFDRDSSLRNFPVWALWTITPDFQRPPFGDTGLVGEADVNRNPLRLFCSLIASRYKDPRAAWLMPEPGNYWINNGVEYILWSDPSIKPVAPGPELPRGRHFEGLGWVAMRTGWDGPADTYSLFGCTDAYYGHNHRDVNGFVIYKNGYLADESRKRIYQTAGHNTLLVFVDGNDGEQRRPKTDLMVRHHDPVVPECDMADIVAFESTPQYVYVCGDGTKAYNWPGNGEYTYSEGRERKTYSPQLESFTRQYVYLLPNTFVVYDRTVSLKPEARKVWQLHTVDEPEVNAATGTVWATYNEGKLTSMTLLPEEPVVKKQLQHLVGAQDTTNALWQVTVERSAPEKAEQFLHVLHVGDAAEYREPLVTRIDGDATVGARVSADGLTYTVVFNTTGPVGGHVTVKKAGQVLIDQDLTTKVQPQKGYVEVR